MNKMYTHFIKTLILVSIIAINCNVFAQTADCDSPGGFSVVPVDNVGGTGTVEDPYQICSTSLLTVQSNGVNPNLGFPNPGLAFFVYYCSPTDTDPEEDYFEIGEGGCFVPVALAESADSAYIINNGTAIFVGESIWNTIGGLPVNIVIVPVILTDITDNTSISYECSGIDLNGNYPHFIVSDPSVNPDCGVNPGDCIVAGGTISTEDNFEFCDDQEVAPNDINISVDGDAGENYAYFLTDENGDIYAGPFDMPVIETINTVNTSGISLIYGLSYDDDAFPDFNIGDNISSLVGECAKLSENSIEIIFYTANAGEIGTDDNTDFLLCTDDDKTVTVTSTGLEAAFSGYVLTDENGVVQKLIQEDGIFDFNDITEVSEFHIYGIASSFELSPIELGSNIEEFTFISCVEATSNFVTVTLEECDPTCEADAGSISDFSDFYCTSTNISPTNDGFNSSNDFAQVYLLTDDALNILAVGTDTEFSLETGAYLFHALNVAVDEAPSDLEDLIGLNAQDVLAGLDCFNFKTSDLITVLEPITISENSAECNDADNTIVAEINISGGLPNNDATTSYEISGDAIGIADADGLFTIEVDNTVEEVTLDVTDDAGCSSSITISFVALNCVVDPTCEADAGLIFGFSDFYCSSTSISPTNVDFNSSTEFVQVYLLTDDALNILAVGTDTEFSLNTGVYLFHALNIAVDEAPVDLEGLIGLNAQDVLAGLDCFSLETSSLMTVLEPLDYSIESIGCNAATGLYDLVLNITGGLPLNDNAANYSLSGDLSESVDADGVLAFSAEPSTAIEFSISDDEGCLINVEYQVASCDSNPCDDLVSGTISINSETTICANVDTFDVFYFVDVELDGNQSNNFAYFTTDADGLILDGPFDLPEFTFDLTQVANYQIFGAAYEGSLNFTIGESIFDVSASECLALTNSINITIEDCIEDITIGDPIFEVDDDTGTYTITFGVFGGTGVYTGTNGVFDENIFNSVEFNCGDSATIVITDDAGNEIEVTFEAPCEAVVECPGDSEAGTLSVSSTLLCANSVLTVGSTGFNNGAEYTQLYIATTGSDYTIAALSEDGTFDGLASGVYQMHALNYYNSEAPTLPNIGESAVNILNQTNACFDLNVNDAITVTILNPIEAVIDYSCNPETGIYTLTFSFNGGLPQYVAENGSAGIAGETIYTVSGDLNGSFIFGENIIIDYTENTSYSMNFYDAFGCVGSASGTPSACSKTAVELLVFDGEAKEEGNLIYWATASEYNSDYFVLEKSKDGITWEQIKSKKAAINSNQSVSYEYLDASNVTGLSYYRLISFDLYGQSDVTEIVTVRNSRTGFEVESIFPIPAQNNISVNIYLSDSQEVKVEIYSLEGKMMKQEIQLGDAGLNKINIDISDFATGVYWVQISSKMELFSQKIIKAL